MLSENNYEDNFSNVQRALSLLNVETIIQNTSYQIMWLPDTGVQQDVINISFIKNLDEYLTSALEIGATDVTGQAGAADTFGLIGTMDATLKFNGHSYRTKLRVTENAIAPILSKKGCIALGLINPEWPYESDPVRVGGGDSNNKRIKTSSDPGQSQDNKASTSGVSTSPISQNVIQLATIINDQSFQINWLPETGSNLELMGASDLKRLDQSLTSKLKPNNTSEVMGEDGKVCKVVGTVDATLSLNGRFHQTEISVCEGVKVPVLSKMGCIALGLINSKWPYSRSTAVSENSMQKHFMIRTTLLAGKKFECSFRERGCNRINMTRREWEDHEAECKFNLSAVRNCPCPFCHKSFLTNDKPPSPLLSRHFVQVHKHETTDLLLTGQETEPVVLTCANFSQTFLPNPGFHFGGILRVVDKASGALLAEYMTVAHCYHPTNQDIDQNTSYALTCCCLSSPPGPAVTQFSPTYLIKSVDSKEHITWSTMPINFAKLKALMIENQKGNQRFYYSIPEDVIRSKYITSDGGFKVEIKLNKIASLYNYSEN